MKINGQDFKKKKNSLAIFRLLLWISIPLKDLENSFFFFFFRFISLYLPINAHFGYKIGDNCFRSLQKISILQCENLNLEAPFEIDKVKDYVCAGSSQELKEIQIIYKCMHFNSYLYQLLN
jgi:hypothetical protein